MEQVLYAKFSRERKNEYAIVTQIVASDGGKRVEKSALTSRGVSHVTNIYSNMDMLKNYYLDERIVITPCTIRKPGTIEFSYVDGVRYDKHFSEIANAGDVSKIQTELKCLQDILYHVKDVQEFSITEKFKEVFEGISGTTLERKKAYTISNVDMIFSNMIIKGEKIYITDYEWVFDFPIPIDYVLYRSLLLNNSFSMLKEDLKKTILAFLDISGEDVRCYEEMENAFQRYVSGRNLFAEYKKNSGKRIMRLDQVSSEMFPNIVQIIELDNEEQIVSRTSIQYRNAIQTKQVFSPDAKKIKVQFDVEGAVLKLQECYAFSKNGEKVLLNVKHNADFAINDDYYFDCNCPYFEFENNDYESFDIKVVVYYENSSVIGYYIRKTIECESKNQQVLAAEERIHQLEAEIERIKSTKAWKLYSKVKKAIKI